MRGRVGSIGSLYDLLYDASADTAVRPDSYLERIAREIRSGAATSVELELEPIEIQPNRAVPVGVFLNEFLSNALKHARVDRAYALAGVRPSRRGNTFELVVSDDGVGFEPAATRGEPGSMRGLSLVRLLAEQLGGRLSADSGPGEGTRMSLSMPLG